MKVLNQKETQLVSGGTTFRVHKKNVDVYTGDIPSHCVANVQSITNVIDANYDHLPTGLFTAIGPHADAIINNGCVSHFATIKDRVVAAGGMS